MAHELFNSNPPNASSEVPEESIEMIKGFLQAVYPGAAFSEEYGTLLSDRGLEIAFSMSFLGPQDLYVLDKIIINLDESNYRYEVQDVSKTNFSQEDLELAAEGALNDLQEGIHEKVLDFDFPKYGAVERFGFDLRTALFSGDSKSLYEKMQDILDSKYTVDAFSGPNQMKGFEIGFSVALLTESKEMVLVKAIGNCVDGSFKFNIVKTQTEEFSQKEINFAAVGAIMDLREGKIFTSQDVYVSDLQHSYNENPGEKISEDLDEKVNERVQVDEIDPSDYELDK